jgi:hypothetical protein
MITNAEKFHFNDFTHKHYAEIIQAAKKNYQFAEYSNSLMHDFNSYILCRHDVDFSVDEAVNLAIIENEFGVTATYFVLLHSDYYNVFEKKVKNAFQRILSLGHRLALHFDPFYFDIENKEQLEKYLLFEKNIIETIFKTNVTVFSFHNPTEEMLKFDDWSYAGLINTYAKEFKENFAYCSDSNGYWRFKRMFDVVSLEIPKKLQILTHPEWWTKEVQSPKEKIWNIIDERAVTNKSEYIQSIENFGRRIIDW